MSENKGGRTRSEAARISILNSTRGMLAREGYDGLTIEGVASDAGVGKQTIYRWWPSKSALVADCIADGGTGLAMAVPVPETQDLRADIEAWLGALTAYAADPQATALLRGLIAAAADSSAVADRMYEQVTRGVELALIHRLRASVGPANDDEEHPAATAVLGAFVYSILVNRPLDASMVGALAELVARSATDE